MINMISSSANRSYFQPICSAKTTLKARMQNFRDRAKTVFSMSGALCPSLQEASQTLHRWSRSSLFLLDSTVVENEILIPQNDMQMKSKASAHIKGEFWHLLSEERGVVCQPCLA